MKLKSFLTTRHRFRWGGVDGDDCTTFCARWIDFDLGADPASSLRGTYKTAAEAAALVDSFGGLIPFIDAHLSPLGFARTDDPRSGDIGVVLAPSALDGDFKKIAAIRFGPLWATLSPSGVVAKAGEHVAAWRRPRAAR